MTEQKLFTGAARGDGESFEDYKLRRKLENALTKRALKGRLIKISKPVAPLTDANHIR